MIKFNIPTAISFTAGLLATGSLYLAGGPLAATAARSAIWSVSSVLGYNAGLFGQFNTWVLAEHAGFHAMSNLLPYSTVIGGTVATSVNSIISPWFTKQTEEVAEQTEEVAEEKKSISIQ
jgi:H+/Cl- antiporter ClcA